MLTMEKTYRKKLPFFCVIFISIAYGLINIWWRYKATIQTHNDNDTGNGATILETKEHKKYVEFTTFDVILR